MAKIKNPLTIVQSGGGTLGTKSITANGTYAASSDSLDGYSEVTVNVPGEQVYFSLQNGNQYTEDVVVPDIAYKTNLLATYRWCPNLKSIRVASPIFTQSQWYQFHANESLTKIECPYFTKITTGSFATLKGLSGDNYGSVQIGSVGNPVTEMHINTFTQEAGMNTDGTNWTVTIYVDAATTADIPPAVDSAPWGATYATVVYRNSTTGEVITATGEVITA